MANINPFYFTLYAAMKRSGMANNGYPKQVPWYTPPRRGDVDKDTAQSEPVTDDDWVVAQSIESAVNSIRNRDGRYRVLADCLDIWEGAYVGAPASRRERCRDQRVNYEACKQSARRCKKEVERLMYG